MTIETALLDRNFRLVESPHDTVTQVLPVHTVAAGEAGTSAPVSQSDVVAAVQQLQMAISTGPNPDFKLDYLSGLSVVTVRSTITGEVVFQLPDTRALELARLIKDGASVGSVGLFSTTA